MIKHIWHDAYNDNGYVSNDVVLDVIIDTSDNSIIQKIGYNASLNEIKDAINSVLLDKKYEYDYS